MSANGLVADSSRKHPLLYQVNTRVVLHEWSQELGRSTTLDDVSDLFLDQIVKLGFQWVWFLGIWQMGDVGRKITLERTDVWKAYGPGLPDVKEEDVAGSPFAIQSYVVSSDFGGDEALARLRERLKARNLRLLLDFVPNHVAIDHPWVQTNPEYFVQGSKTEVARARQNYTRLPAKDGKEEIDFAHGRDPNFDGWSDTLQLEYRNPALCDAMKEELASIARRCDGVRCDMAMLLLPEIFETTWGKSKATTTTLGIKHSSSTPMPDFWREAIPFSRKANPQFMFMAEVYWDLEYALQQEGFDYTYDKRLYDRLLEGNGEAVAGHLRADYNFMKKCVHFLENHDEERAASPKAFGNEMKIRSAALISYLVPGLNFFYEGQLEGRKSKVAIQLRRRPEEVVDTDLKSFYDRLLDILKRPEVRLGEWKLWEVHPRNRKANPNYLASANATYRQYVVFSWSDEKQNTLLVVVNFSPTGGSCSLDFSDLGKGAVLGKRYALTDLLGDNDRFFEYEKSSELVFSALAPWGYRVYDVSAF